MRLLKLFLASSNFKLVMYSMIIDTIPSIHSFLFLFYQSDENRALAINLLIYVFLLVVYKGQQIGLFKLIFDCKVVKFLFGMDDIEAAVFYSKRMDTLLVFLYCILMMDADIRRSREGGGGRLGFVAKIWWGLFLGLEIYCYALLLR